MRIAFEISDARMHVSAEGSRRDLYIDRVQITVKANRPFFVKQCFAKYRNNRVNLSRVNIHVQLDWGGQRETLIGFLQGQERQ